MVDPQISRLDLLEKRIGHRFRDRRWLRQAMRHGSAADARRPSNQRLEFLGDAVLGLILAERLFRQRPPRTEGAMTEAKSVQGSDETLEQTGRSLGLAECLEVGGGLQQKGRYPGSMLADAYEALLGAAYLDGGLGAARKVAHKTLTGTTGKTAATPGQQDYKSRLQEAVQARCEPPPTYRIVSEQGPDHAKSFLMAVDIGGREAGRGKGKSKKDAEQRAARSALKTVLRKDD